MTRFALTSTAVLLGSAMSASAATFSVIELNEDGQYQNPSNLVVDLMLGGRTPGQQTERDVRAGRNNGQSFTITSATVIDQVAINYSALQAGVDTTFEFFRVASADAGTLTPDGEIIDSVTFNGSDAGFGGHVAGTLVFDVINTVAAAGDMFAIRFVTTGSPYSLRWEILDNNTNASYDGGTAYENGTTFNKIYALGVVAVPEPASAALLGAGCLLFASRRRDG